MQSMRLGYIGRGSEMAGKIFLSIEGHEIAKNLFKLIYSIFLRMKKSKLLQFLFLRVKIKYQCLHLTPSVSDREYSEERLREYSTISS